MTKTAPEADGSELCDSDAPFPLLEMMRPTGLPGVDIGRLFPPSPFAFCLVSRHLLVFVFSHETNIECTKNPFHDQK